jgi:hypothetical protein
MNQLSGYTEIEWGGKVYPFKFGTNAWAIFCQDRGIEFGQIGDTGVFGKWEGEQMVKGPNMIALFDLYYCAYVSAVRAKGEKPQPKEFIMDILDDVEGSFAELQDTMVRGKLLGFTMGAAVTNPPTP